ncbi:hypothetical protein [Micromonospora sp. SL4-19]|uniref:hypothetical protein n=1 Tax=Micromonospora sp. SL4-19 TaxID=3399129 RepID=UPI003A4D6E08
MVQLSGRLPYGSVNRRDHARQHVGQAVASEDTDDGLGGRTVGAAHGGNWPGRKEDRFFSYPRGIGA